MNVRFFAGTRAQYDSLPAPRNPLGLYFCEDTKELFWADRLLTDGIRVVPTHSDLPELSTAADGVVYYVTETRNGYTLSPDRQEWLQTIYAPATDAYRVPESEYYNTVTTVGAVRDIENRIYSDVNRLERRIANIEIGSAESGVESIYFAGVKFDKLNGTYTMDRLCALRALGFVLPEDQAEDEEVELITKDYVDSQISAFESVYAKKTDLESLASTNYVDEKVASIEIPVIPTNVSAFENDLGYITEHQDISNLATKDEVRVVSSAIEAVSASNNIAHVAISEAKQAIATKADIAHNHDDIYDVKGAAEAVKNDLLNGAGTAFDSLKELGDLISDNVDAIDALTSIASNKADKEHQHEQYLTSDDLAEYARKDELLNTDSKKYEILPLDGMLVNYFESEVRVNTEHVDINSLPPQSAGDGSSDTYYYMTFRAFAPEGATSVIEGQSDKMDTEHSELATDKYGRKYTTIWAAIASKSGNAWSKFGDRSTVDKYLGFYYNFHWYAGDKLIGADKVRVILTNDACHNDLVPDAVARRIDEKVTTIKIPEVDLTGYATEEFVAAEIAKINIPDVSGFITEIPEEYITADELAAEGFIKEHQSLEGYAKLADIPSYDTFATKEALQTIATDVDALDITAVKERYEVLRVPGLEVMHRDDEIRLNTEHVELSPQNVGDGGESNAYYIGINIYAPANAESVRQNITSAPGIQEDKEIVPFTATDTDSYGRKYSTIWVKCAVYQNGAWLNYGMNSTSAKCLGYYYTVEWYDNSGNIIENDSIHIVFTNDSCHYSNISDAVSRRFITVEDAIAAINIPEIPTKVSELENDAGYITLNDVPDTYALATKEELAVAVANKANDILFTEDYRVGTSIGQFIEKETVQNMTLSQIITKLLGLTLYVPPAENLPEGTTPTVENIVVNEVPVHVLGEDGCTIELTYDYKTLTPTDAKSDDQTGTYVYQIVDPDTGELTESGYHISTIYQENDYLTVFIPDIVTKFHVEEYSALAGDWSQPNWPLVRNDNYSIDGYIAYTVPEEFGITSGIAVRIVIEN